MTEVWLPIRAVPIRENSASLAAVSAVARPPRRRGAELAALLVESTGSNRAKSDSVCPCTAPAPSNSSALRNTATVPDLIDPAPNPEFKALSAVNSAFLFVLRFALLFVSTISLEPACSRTFCFLTFLYLFRFCGFLLFYCFLPFLRYLNFLRFSTFLRFCVSFAACPLTAAFFSHLFLGYFYPSFTFTFAFLSPTFALASNPPALFSLALYSAFYLALYFVLDFSPASFHACSRTFFCNVFRNNFYNGFCNSCRNDSIKPVAFFAVTGALAFTTD
jgi:hypothetical protein